jgi:hypothetical protein
MKTTLGELRQFISLELKREARNADLHQWKISGLKRRNPAMYDQVLQALKKFLNETHVYAQLLQEISSTPEGVLARFPNATVMWRDSDPLWDEGAFNIGPNGEPSPYNQGAKPDPKNRQIWLHRYQPLPDDPPHRVLKPGYMYPGSAIQFKLQQH